MSRPTLLTLSDFTRLPRPRQIALVVVTIALWILLNYMMQSLFDSILFANRWSFGAALELGLAIYFGWPVLLLTGLLRLVSLWIWMGETQTLGSVFALGIAPTILTWPLALPLRRTAYFKGRFDSFAVVYLLAPVLLGGTFLKAAAVVAISVAAGAIEGEGMWMAVIHWWSGNLAGQATVLPVLLGLIAPWIAGRRDWDRRRVPLLIVFSWAAMMLWFALAYLTPVDHFNYWYFAIPLNLGAIWLLPLNYALVYVSVLNFSLAAFRSWIPSGASPLEEQLFLTVLTYTTFFLGVLRADNERMLSLMENARRLTDDALKERAHFLTMLASELRKPLNMIIAFADMSESLGGPSSSSANAVRKSAGRLFEIVEKMNFLGTSGMSSRPLEIKDVAVTGLVKNVIGRYLPKARAKQMDLILEDKLHGARSIQTSAVCLELALGELLDNAIKFSRHGTIKVSVGPGAGGRVRFTVEDEGIGVDVGTINRLLNTFEQGEKGFGRRFQGLGIGLAFVSLLVEILHGQLRIEHAADHPGACFIFEIPDLRS